MYGRRMAQSVYRLDLDAYWRDGVYWPAGRVDVDGLDEHFFEVQRQSTERRGRELHISPHLVSTDIDRLAHDTTILDCVEQLLGPDFVLWESDFARKPPGAVGHIPWHADGPYWNLSTNEVVTVWVALTDVSAENAAMQVVPRTHRQAGASHLAYDGDPMAANLAGIRTASEGNVFGHDSVIADNIDPDEHAVYVELSPGEFSVHHVDLVHGGGPNESAVDRIGIAFRYISARTYCHTALDSVTACRGTVNNDQLVLEPRPQRSFSEEAWQAHEAAMAYPSGFGDRTMTPK